MSHLDTSQKQTVLKQIRDSLAVLDKSEPNFIEFVTLDLQKVEENWARQVEKMVMAEFVALWKRSVSRGFLNTLRQSSLIR